MIASHCNLIFYCGLCRIVLKAITPSLDRYSLIILLLLFICTRSLLLINKKIGQQWSAVLCSIVSIYYFNLYSSLITSYIILLFLGSDFQRRKTFLRRFFNRRHSRVDGRSLCCSVSFNIIQ